MKKNGQDDLIRKLERRVLSGDFSAVPQLALLYAKTGRYSEVEPEDGKVYTALSYNIENNDAYVDTFTNRADAVAFFNDMIIDTAKRRIRAPGDDDSDYMGIDLESAAMITDDPENAWDIYENEVQFDSGINLSVLEGSLNKKYEPPAPQAGDTSFMPPHFTREELEAMPTLGTGQTDSRKYDQNGWRVWLSRGGLADGEALAGRVTVEHIVDGVWRRWEEYDVGPPADEEPEEPPPPPRRRRLAPKG